MQCYIEKRVKAFSGKNEKSVLKTLSENAFRKRFHLRYIEIKCKRFHENDFQGKNLQGATLGDFFKK